MQVTYRTLVNSVGSLNQLLSKQMDGRTAMRLSRAMSEIETHLQHWRAGRSKILENHNVAEEQLQDSTVDEATLSQLDTDIGELLEEEIEVNIKPIDIAPLENVDNIEPAIFFNLGWLFKDDD